MSPSATQNIAMSASHAISSHPRTFLGSSELPREDSAARTPHPIADPASHAFLAVSAA